MTGLENWLIEATKGLSQDSAVQVRTEIQQHYESARDTAIEGGAPADEADRLALAALGDAATANRQYRRVLLTAGEARVLSEGNREARAFCPHSTTMRWLAAIPVVALWAAAALYLAGSVSIAESVLSGAIMMGLLFTAPYLPVYTPSRSRVFRSVKWVVMMCAFVVAFGPLKNLWFMAPFVWFVTRVEWTRNSIRRKLPVSRWPRQLYL
jgi:hypothetical protein